jgi:hypothetical protein
MRGQRSQSFPVGLYGLCLFALCALAVPGFGGPLERWLVGAATLPLRAWSALGEPAAAATAASSTSLQRLVARLDDRVRQHALAGELMPADTVPELCTVAEVLRPGGGGAPTELRLALRQGDVAECLALVTSGEQLIGFLCRPGEGPALFDKPTDPARVLLLNHADCRRVAAVVATATAGPLRCIVEPAAAVDPAPLRTGLWEDPYSAANPKTMVSDLEVRTVALPRGAWDSEVPGGLRLGTTRVWGYPTVTIGVYVAPSYDARALSHVVLWRRAAAAPLPSPSPHSIAAMLHPLPGGSGDRSHLSTAFGNRLRDGAAVVQDGICLGCVHSLGFGQGLMTSFAASRRRWSLLLLPDRADIAPQEAVGEVAYAVDNTAYVRQLGRGSVLEPDEALGAGWLFTGSNGPDCPPGLLIGRAEPDPRSGLLAVVMQGTPGAAAVAVLAGGGGR